jgi:hypothetical protein
MNTPACIVVELCTSYVGNNANPRHYQVRSSTSTLPCDLRAEQRDPERGPALQRADAACCTFRQEHYQEFIQHLSNVHLPCDVTLVHNMATVEMLEWLAVKKGLKAMKGGKKGWGPSNLEQERHKEGEFPRIGAFEVFVLSTVETESGKQTVIHEAFSKLHSNRWPIINILVHRVVKALARICKRDSSVPRCSAVFLNPIGKLFDCHSHPDGAGAASKSLFIPSMRCWVHPEVAPAPAPAPARARARRPPACSAGTPPPARDARRARTRGSRRAARGSRRAGR